MLGYNLNLTSVLLKKLGGKAPADSSALGMYACAPAPLTAPPPARPRRRPHPGPRAGQPPLQTAL